MDEDKAKEDGEEAEAEGSADQPSQGMSEEDATREAAPVVRVSRPRSFRPRLTLCRWWLNIYAAANHYPFITVPPPVPGEGILLLLVGDLVSWKQLLYPFLLTLVLPSVNTSV